MTTPFDPQGTHGEPAPPDPAELAELFAAGALSDSERDEFEARVAAGDAAFVAEYRRVLPVLQSLLSQTPAADPPPHLRDALLNRIAAEQTDVETTAHSPDAADDQGAPLVVYRFADLTYRPTGLPGVSARTLFADRRANRRSLILKMEPGSALPDHEHSGIEEVLMIEGDLSIDACTLGPRDYFRTLPGTRHGMPRTKHGCYCLVFSDFGSLSPKTKLGMAVWAAREWIRRGLRRSA